MMGPVKRFHYLSTSCCTFDTTRHEFLSSVKSIVNFGQALIVHFTYCLIILSLAAGDGGYTFHEGKYHCKGCNRSYQCLTSWTYHKRWVCGKDPQFQCPECPYRARHNVTLKNHLMAKHGTAAFNSYIGRCKSGI